MTRKEVINILEDASKKGIFHKHKGGMNIFYRSKPFCIIAGTSSIYFIVQPFMCVAGGIRTIIGNLNSNYDDIKNINIISNKEIHITLNCGAVFSMHDKMEY